MKSLPSIFEDVFDIDQKLPVPKKGDVYSGHIIKGISPGEYVEFEHFEIQNDQDVLDLMFLGGKHIIVNYLIISLTKKELDLQGLSLQSSSNITIFNSNPKNVLSNCKIYAHQLNVLTQGLYNKPKKGIQPLITKNVELSITDELLVHGVCIPEFKDMFAENISLKCREFPLDLQTMINDPHNLRIKDFKKYEQQIIDYIWKGKQKFSNITHFVELQSDTGNHRSTDSINQTIQNFRF